jgi:homoserine O-acetyltransferase
MRCQGGRGARRVALVACLALGISAQAQQPTGGNAAAATPVDGLFLVRDFRFKTGETLPELRIVYRTLGTPRRDASGRVTNAVLMLHGTSGSGASFLIPSYTTGMFAEGQPLDASRYYLVIPDNIGTGGSSKPSDGLRMRFPKYEYDDMVAAHYRLLTEHLEVDHLRLLFGTSQGCMHAYLWSVQHPAFMDATFAMACQPVEIAGVNRMRRKMMADAIMNDPAWMGGNYVQQPKAGLASALLMSAMVGVSQLDFQIRYPTRAAMDTYVEDYIARELPRRDANDVLYQYDASRNYDPRTDLDKITAPFLHVNTADDLINPPELGNVEREIKKVKNGGHQSYNYPDLWKSYLEGLWKESSR